MIKKDDTEEFVGCGGNCACAQASDDKDTCASPKETATLDKDGKCPCGKSADECCHQDKADENDALHELCEPHNGKHVCDIASDLQKTGI